MMASAPSSPLVILAPLSPTPSMRGPLSPGLMSPTSVTSASQRQCHGRLVRYYGAPKLTCRFHKCRLEYLVKYYGLTQLVAQYASAEKVVKAQAVLDLCCCVLVGMRPERVCAGRPKSKTLDSDSSTGDEGVCAAGLLYDTLLNDADGDVDRAALTAYRCMRQDIYTAGPPANPAALPTASELRILFDTGFTTNPFLSSKLDHAASSDVSTPSDDVETSRVPLSPPRKPASNSGILLSPKRKVGIPGSPATPAAGSKRARPDVSPGERMTVLLEVVAQQISALGHSPWNGHDVAVPTS